MKKSFAIVVFTVFFISAIAQRWDVNWTFGYNAGINFSDTANPVAFYSHANNREAVGCISNAIGNLVFSVIGDENDFYNSRFNVIDANGNLITNGDGIFCHQSITNGILIIPSILNSDSIFLILHLGVSDPFFDQTLNLYKTVVEIKNTGELNVTEKNVLLINNILSEKLAAVKHADGKNWWIFSLMKIFSTNSYQLTYCYFQFKNGNLFGPYYANVSSISNYIYAGPGEMTFSFTGKYLATIEHSNKIVELFEFNRCTGELYIIKTYTFNTASHPYGLEFSKNEEVLYVTSGWTGGSSYIYQFIINDSIPFLPNQIYYTSDYYIGQLQLASNYKIYVSNKDNSGLGTFSFNQFTQNMGVINHPDSIGMACNFQPLSYSINDSSKLSEGLPHFPNYNLGPLSIYQASAGEDKIICIEDTTIKGVLLGVPAVAGVQYAWQGDSLNYTDIAQPFANPMQTTMYVVTLTDTSIKYSCQSREDTVWVVVKDCSVGIGHQSTVNRPQIKIYPNPATSTIHVTVRNTQYAVQTITLTDINGKQILQTTQTEISVSQLARGLYFINVELRNGERYITKVVIQ